MRRRPTTRRRRMMMSRWRGVFALSSFPFLVS
jgi:hypothetical protein